MENCPNCNETLKSSMFKTVTLVSQKRTDNLNELLDEKKEGFCTKCYPQRLENARSKIAGKIKNLEGYIRLNISAIPVITTHTPLNWNYEILEMITGQSTTGTGVITEFSSSFTDFFGASSGRHNKKLKAGEDNCINQLRMQTLLLGGNAIIATDIDYSEIGSGKGILMVCMAGTAVNVLNTEVFGDKKQELISNLKKALNRLNFLNNLEFDNATFS